MNVLSTKEDVNDVKENDSNTIDLINQHFNKINFDDAETRKKMFVNNDGTIAESHDTYKQFKSDLSQRSYGW